MNRIDSLSVLKIFAVFFERAVKPKGPTHHSSFNFSDVLGVATMKVRPAPVEVNNTALEELEEDVEIEELGSFNRSPSLRDDPQTAKVDIKWITVTREDFNEIVSLARYVNRLCRYTPVSH